GHRSRSAATVPMVSCQYSTLFGSTSPRSCSTTPTIAPRALGAPGVPGLASWRSMATMADRTRRTLVGVAAAVAVLAVARALPTLLGSGRQDMVRPRVAATSTIATTATSTPATAGAGPTGPPFAVGIVHTTVVDP